MNSLITNKKVYGLIIVFVFNLQFVCSQTQDNHSSDIIYKENTLRVSVSNEDALPIHLSGDNPITRNNALNEIFNEYQVTYYAQEFPTAITPRLQTLYKVICEDCEVNELKNEFENTFSNSFNTVKRVGKLTLDNFQSSTVASEPDDYNNYDLYHLDLIDAIEAWDITTGSPTVKIGVIDNQFKADHEDLVNKVDYIDDPSYTIPMGNGGHGTVTAGIVAGETNNEIGISSIGYDCRLLLYKMEPSDDDDDELSTYNQMLLASQAGAKVINCSFGKYEYDSDEQLIVDEIHQNGTVIVATSGNHNITTYRYPGCYNHVVGVAYTDHDDYKHEDSNYNDKIDISAPGDEIWSTTVYNINYNINTGSSFAAPIVSGVCGLILSVNPCLSTEGVENILKATADDIYSIPVNSSYDGLLGAGRVNAHKAVQLAQESNSTTLDLFMRDTPIDFGQSPSPSNTGAGRDNSPDIWVRNDNNGEEYQESQMLIYDPDNPFYAYVRVQNKSCVTSSGGTLSLYWSNLGTAQSWPENWYGIDNDNGGVIGSITIPDIEPGESEIIEFPWDMSDFIAEENGTTINACLLARIEGIDDDPIIPYPNSLYNQILYNNNVTQRNVSILNASWMQITDQTSNTNKHITEVWIGSESEQATEKYDIHVYSPEVEGQASITQEAEITLKLDDATWAKWQNSEQNDIGVERFRQEPQTLLVTSENIKLSGLSFAPGERSTIGLGYNFLTDKVSNQNHFTYRIEQTRTVDNSMIGGVTFEIYKENRTLFDADAGDDQEIDLGANLTITADDINEAAEYFWYDSNGNLVYVGKDLTVSPEITKKYKLEIIALADGFKDYDEIEVKVIQHKINSVSPNPASNYTSINYTINENVSSAYMMILGTSNPVSNNYILDSNQSETTIDVSNYPIGVYSVLLICDGQIVDAESILIQ